jgi:outer membrane protein TolC
MDAAQHGLDEFKANLSRFEPFTEARGDATRFPERRDSRGTSGEIVGGIEKETFEGARFRIEGGASTSRVRFGEVEQDQDAVEEGSGGLVRGRIEVPFVGSRRRQERIINQAFQESRARQAKLTYLDAYREYAVSALQYYQAALLYQADAAAYEHKRRELATLRQNPRVRPEDRDRLDSSAADAVVYRDQYLNYRRDAILSLLAALGLGPDAPYVLVESEYAPSEYLDKSATQEGLARMIEDAYFNNPRFRVLDNAIRDAELQRQQAIVGRYDITAFVEGTQFPFGAETYDDRVGGWQVGAGVTVRLNDQRVLTASRLKAEAQIRAYQAQIETERLNIQRKISTHTSTLRSNHQVRLQLLENVKQKQAAFEYRTRVYLSGGPPPMTIDDVLIPLSEMISAEIQLASNAYYSGLADIAIMAATGEVYRVVGMAIDEAAAAASGP